MPGLSVNELALHLEHVTLQSHLRTVRAIEVLTRLCRDGYFRDPAKRQLLDKDENLTAL